MKGVQIMGKKKVYFLYLFWIGSILISQLLGAASGKAAQTVKPKEPVYTVLDPRSYEPSVEYRGINPRLDTLKGKKVIVVNLHGGNEEIMESIASGLKAAVPSCNVVYYPVKGLWDRLHREDWDTILACDAAILGHNY